MSNARLIGSAPVLLVADGVASVSHYETRATESVGLGCYPISQIRDRVDLGRYIRRQGFNVS